MKYAKIIEQCPVTLDATIDAASSTFTLSSETDTMSESSTSSGLLVPTYNKDTCFLGIEQFFQVPQFPDFNLTQLLDESAMGKNVLLHYQKNNILDGYHRTLLVDIIIKHLFTYILKQLVHHTL